MTTNQIKYTIKNILISTWIKIATKTYQKRANYNSLQLAITFQNIIIEFNYHWNLIYWMSQIEFLKYLEIKKLILVLKTLIYNLNRQHHLL